MGLGRHLVYWLEPEIHLRRLAWWRPNQNGSTATAHDLPTWANRKCSVALKCQIGAATPIIWEDRFCPRRAGFAVLGRHRAPSGHLPTNSARVSPRRICPLAKADRQRQPAFSQAELGVSSPITVANSSGL
jgi:hypothetical protein